MRNTEATRFLVAYVRTGEATHKPAALDALGMVADPASAPVLAEAAGHPDENVRSAAVAALIALADAEQQRGGDLARRCYRRAYDCAVTPAQRTAALMGLAETDPSQRVQWLLKGLAEDHSRRLAYAGLLRVDSAELAGALTRRMQEAEGDELEALRALAEAKGIGGAP
jgi:HEAT repeat protein